MERKYYPYTNVCPHCKSKGQVRRSNDGSVSCLTCGWHYKYGDKHSAHFGNTTKVNKMGRFLPR